MKPETAIELLKMTSDLTQSALAAKAKTARNTAKADVETVFEDCLAIVSTHYKKLTTAN